MGDTLKKVQPGDPLRIPAATFNTILDAARDFQQRQRSVSHAARPQIRQPGVVLVRNDSGADLDRFAVVGLDDVLIDPADNLAEFQNHIAFSAVVPTVDHAGRWAILQEPLADGAIGQAVAAGVTPVQVDMASESHRHAALDPGESGHLQSATSGAEILWVKSGTGVKWAAIRFAGGTGDTDLVASSRLYLPADATTGEQAIDARDWRDRTIQFSMLLYSNFDGYGYPDPDSTIVTIGTFGTGYGAEGTVRCGGGIGSGWHEFANLIALYAAGENLRWQIDGDTGAMRWWWNNCRPG